MNKRITSAATLAGFLGLVSATTFALHRLGQVRWLSIDWPNLRQWLSSTPPDDAILAAARLAGLACGWWILLSTSFYLAARWSRIAPAMRLATPLAIPFTRTLGAQVLVGAVAATTLGSPIPALASTDRPASTWQLDSFPVPLPTQLSDSPVPVEEPSDSDIFRFPHPVFKLGAPTFGSPVVPGHSSHDGGRSVSPVEQPTPGSRYRIAAGDNLWDIAQRVVSQAPGHPPTIQQIASYWVDLIEANRGEIRSGDPNLIFPDENILIPPTKRI